MTLQRAALLTAGSLAAPGLSTALAHADDTVDLFSGDNIAITSDFVQSDTEVAGELSQQRCHIPARPSGGLTARPE